MSFFWHDDNIGCLRPVFDCNCVGAVEHDDRLLAGSDTSSANACLKIILKVKDEAFFLEGWIRYHAGIVGYCNIVIVDCGSTDPEHLAVLERYRSRVLVLNYRAHYDSLHSSPANRVFFQALARHCRYVTVIDADEFLFGVREDSISARAVLGILSDSDDLVHAGTWFGNVGNVAVKDNVLDLSVSHSFEACPAAIKNGTFSGKAVIRTDTAIHARHVGHNLHVKEVVSLMTEHAFGAVGIFHFNALSPSLQKERALKHLRGKNVVPPEVEAPADVERLVQQLLEMGGQQRSIMKYLGAYAAPISLSAVDPCKSSILDGHTVERDSPIAAKLRAFPFGDLLRRRRAELGMIT